MPTRSPINRSMPIRARATAYGPSEYDIPPLMIPGAVSSPVSTPGYPVRPPMAILSTWVTVRDPNGTSVTFAVQVNYVTVSIHTVSSAGLTIFAEDIALYPNDVVTLAVTNVGSGDLRDLLIRLITSPYVVECIPDVMGSGLWENPYDTPLTYDVDGDFYWPAVNTGPQAMYWPTAFTGTQSIQVTVSNFGPLGDGGDILLLWCRSADIFDGDSGIQFWVRKYEDPDDGPLWHWFVSWDDGNEVYAPEGDFPSGLLFWPYGESTAFRLESDVDGAFRIYVDDGLLYSGTNPGQPVGATQIGFAGERYAPGGSSATMHMTDICILASEYGDSGPGPEPEPGDFHDDFAAAPTLDFSADAMFTGTNVGATSDGAGDPFLVDEWGTHTVWATFTATATGTIRLTTEGSSFDTVLGVYTGSFGSLTEIAINDDTEEPTPPGENTLRWSDVTLTVTAGVTYYIGITGYDDAETGSIVLNLTVAANPPGVTTPDTVVVVVSTPPVVGAPSLRDPLLWPYPPDSIWNMPIGQSANLVPLGFNYLGDTVNQNSRVTLAEENILCLDPDAPLAWVMEHNAGWTGALRCSSRTGDHLTGNGSWTPVQLPVPVGFVTDPYIGQRPNMSGALVYRAGSDLRLAETQPLHICSDGVAVSQFINSSWVGDSILTGGGGGARGGSHGGSFLTAFGGTIRLGELVPGGVIKHALKLVFDTTYYCSRGGSAGHVWPATRADNGWATNYGSNNPSVPDQAKMGMLLTLPSSFNVDGLSSPAAKILARAVRDYGAYLCDGDAFAPISHLCQWQVERSNNGSFVTDFHSAWGFHFFHQPALHGTPSAAQLQFRADVGLFMEAICIVADNAPGNVGGAGTRRAALAPPL